MLYGVHFKIDINIDTVQHNPIKYVTNHLYGDSAIYSSHHNIKRHKFSCVTVPHFRIHELSLCNEIIILIGNEKFEY